MKERYLNRLALLFLLMGACGDSNYFTNTAGIHDTQIAQAGIEISQNQWDAAEVRTRAILVDDPNSKGGNGLLVKILLHKAGTSILELIANSFADSSSGSSLTLFDVMKNINGLADEDEAALFAAIVKLKVSDELSGNDADKVQKKSLAYAAIASTASMLKRLVYNADGQFDPITAASNLTPEKVDKVVSTLQTAKQSFADSGELTKETAVDEALAKVVDPTTGKGNQAKIIEYLATKAGSGSAPDLPSGGGF